MDERPIEISIVIPLYNEEESIKELYNQINAAMLPVEIPYEIVFVDDGSQDKTFEIVKEIRSRDERIRGVKLNRNYGQLYAFLAGFEVCQGETIITMDGDLQNDVRDIQELLKRINEGFDFVTGWRYNRNDPVVRRLISILENRLIWMRTGVRLHDYGCPFTATRKDIIDRLREYGATARFIKPLIVKLTDSVAEIKIRHYPRKYGTSRYSFFAIIKSGVDFFLNFNVKPKKESPLYCIEERVGF